MYLKTGQGIAARIPGMELPPTNLSWFAETLSETIQDIIDAWNANGAVAASDEVAPELIRAGLQQLIEVLQRQEWMAGPGLREELEPVDVSELGDYGLTMLTDLFGLARDLQLPEACSELERLALSLGLWVVEQQGELSSIDLLVNGIARVANHTSSALELEQLFYLMGDILDAISAPAGDDSDDEPSPRKLLLLNRAIVATRSLSPELMEVAFTEVSEQMPKEAPAFFREGMEQVQVQNYPDPVRQVIERFYLDWYRPTTLH